MTTTDPLYDPSDRDVQDFYCKHGTFTGNPYGGDYLCGWCESGEEPPTQQELDRRTIRRAEEAYDHLMSSLVEHLPRQSVYNVLAWVINRGDWAIDQAWHRSQAV